VIGRDNSEVNKVVAKMTALGRALVPDDNGRMIAALLSGDNRLVNGQRIEGAGGMALQECDFCSLPDTRSRLWTSPDRRLLP
jgi:hypothetical protein